MSKDGFDAEMQRALEADAEKLAQLTGEDHGPFDLDDYLVDDDPQPSEYRGFTISFEYPPVPTREWDWAAYRTNDPEGGFRAYGRTYDECKREIDALLDD